MSSGFSAYGDLDSDGDFIEDYKETSTIPKKDWFKPANASLARLDKVKPVATVYNLGLRDPRDLQAGRGKPAPVPVASPISELQTEPPLSTLSYQKAAWGSQTSIPELLKQAAQAGTRPSRPSSAKTGSISKLPQSRKVRPQSAKDPLCPPGKKKNGSTFGVKGQKCDPSERAAKFGAPSAGNCVGWAGPPAGLCDPSGDVVINSISSANSEQQKSQMPPPPPPHTSPEPDDHNNSARDYRQYSPAPSPVCLSLSLPSADVDASDDMDTGRLMEEADKFVKTHKKKESQKMKYFKADKHSPRKAGEARRTIHPTQLKPSHVVSSPASQEPERVEVAENGLQAPVTPQDDGFEEIMDSSDEQQQDSLLQESIKGNSAGGEGDLSALGLKSELSLELESEEEDVEEETEKPLPPSNGFDLEYLGPAQKGKKTRSHPIFLMPDKKPDLHKEARPPSSGKKPCHDHHKNVEKHKVAAKETKREPVTDTALQQKNATHATMSRSGVHIREDCNVTVDITPRNIGRKVPARSRKSKAGNDPVDFEIKNEWSGRPTSAEEGKMRSADLNPYPEITTTGTKNRTVIPTSNTTSAATVSVVYDDDDDDDDTSSKKKARRRRGLIKEKDLVTMVSNLSLSDEDKVSDVDDPSEEMDVPLGGGSGDHSHVEMGRSPSTLSRGERNYYDIARKQTKDDSTSLEEKENVITMTTKTLLFDPDKPTESVVKTILDAPLAKSKEHTGRASPEKPVTRLKSALRPPSAKLSKSDLYSITPVDDPVPTDSTDDSNGDGGFTSCRNRRFPPDEDRPESRMGFIPKGKDDVVSSDEEERNCSESVADKRQPGGINQRPPSGKRRPLSAASKTLNRPPSASNRQRHQNVKESVQTKRRPQSASSAVSHSPSTADIHRANAAAQALRSEREAVSKTLSSRSGSHFAGSQRHYASYSKSGGQSRAQSASVTVKPVVITSNNPNLEFDDTESMAECKEIHNRLARYGIDIRPETLERALFPPTGKTLYYQLDAQLPTSYTNGLLSHPRYWLPEEYKKLKIAEKKLAMAELMLWKQKKEEERKARLAMGKEKTTKIEKKKGKKKLKRRQSVC